MAQPKPPLASADDIEAAFYEALQGADLDRLMSLWADDDEVSCVHPGGPRAIGHGAIRASFEAIFANGSIDARAERVHRVSGHSHAVHSVVEKIRLLTPQGPQFAWVLATNVYVKTAQGWRMVVHHASPGSQLEIQEISEAPSVLH